MLLRCLVLFAAICVVTPSGRGAPLPDEKPVPAALVGKWQVIEFYLHGVKQPPEACAERQVFISGDGVLSLVVVTRGRVDDNFKFRCRTDAGRTPKEIDLFETKGKGRTLAIYRDENNECTISFGNPNSGKRPTAFQPAVGGGHFQYTLTRIQGP